ncbi:MAG: hypothetical protein V2B20_14900 [Pseudomonadota bacterium]
MLIFKQSSAALVVNLKKSLRKILNIVKPVRPLHDLFVSFTLTAVLHLLIIKTAVLPPGNYFFPFIEEKQQEAEQMLEAQRPGAVPGGEAAAVKNLPTQEAAGATNEGIAAIPYSHAARYKTTVAMVTALGVPISSLLSPLISGKVGYRSLARQTAGIRLSPPQFSSSTIPPRPEKSMGRMVDEDAEAMLLGSVFQDAIPASSDHSEQLLRAEAEFIEVLKKDIVDGRLDMAFSTFIISAEYFHLSRALLPLGQQPSFSLEEADARYRQRLQRVGEGLPKEIDGYSLVMLLQRYAENKFYPGNGSGMLLDSLFHNQNDCEGGTKEVLAYLQALYPALSLGSNRGMLQTTTGELIGHMQVFIGPGPTSEKILANPHGVIVETTRVSLNSVLPYGSGDVFPLEDFVVRYYPGIVAGTPLERALSSGVQLGEDEASRIVGTSDSPLKMSYGASTTLLAEQFYDLANIRTQRIENEFLRSKIPSCNPQIDPTKIDRTNLFSNFVAIDRRLRKSLIAHYLADLQYWDNEVMPQWREPEFLATYDDLVGSLLDKNSETSGYIQIDAENSVPRRSLESHGRFLKALRDEAEQAKDQYLGMGRQECSRRALLDDRLLGFLFKSPEGPGIFFLPAPDENLQWEDFLGDVMKDCLAMPAAAGERSLLGALEEEVAGGQTSLRKEVYNRAQLRGLAPFTGEHNLEAMEPALSQVISGSTGSPDSVGILAKRQSSASTPEEPSVQETLEERGRTGINSGLVWDVADFLGAAKVSSLFLQYGKRGDLRLTIPRAQELVAQLTASLGGEFAAEFLATLKEATQDRTLQLAAALHLAKLQGVSSVAISRMALDYLRGSEVYRAENLLALLQYGLLADDALAFIQKRVAQLLVQLPKLGDGNGTDDLHLQPFAELMEIVRTLQGLPDPRTWQVLHDGLVASMSADFKSKPAAGRSPKEVVDYGLLFNKLAVLSLLHEQTKGTKGIDAQLSVAWLQQFINFAAINPIGKLMLDPVVKIAGDEGLATALRTLIPAQMKILDRLKGSGDQLAARLREVKAVLGEGNVIIRMLLLTDDALVSRLSGLPVEQLAGNPKNKAAWYLERLHRRIVQVIGNTGKGSMPDGNANDLLQKSTASTDPLLDFYLDDRVRESFAMLAYLQVGGNGDDGVRFRKTQDLATIKDPGKLRVIEGERKITRQDMSLLTLALNPGNSTQAIRRAWEETLAVTGKHLALRSLDQELRHYLFAPHSPYLTENDSGFFFSPEAVGDLHNAAHWGGRNDILLSSYLHFRNLPGRLPDWLRRTAIARSELELSIVKKFEQQSFLPMILECDSDKKEMPDPLFRAKWAIRKPFGEDIFPGTLLLLRLGYLEITAAGEIIRTSKYAGG